MGKLTAEWLAASVLVAFVYTCWRVLDALGHHFDWLPF